jgi:hypothetical protein
VTRQQISGISKIIGRAVVATFAVAAPVLATAGTASAAPTAFTPGDLVIYRVGAGAVTLSSVATAVSLDDYSTSGTYSGYSVALPTTASGNQRAVTASGSATSEGLISDTADGYLLASGYDAAPGTTGVASTTCTSGVGTYRSIAVVSGSGSIDSSTGICHGLSGNNVRGVAANSGTTGSGIWVTGAGGLDYVTIGSSSDGLALTTSNLRAADLYNGQLYASSASGANRLATVGSGEPTTAGQTVANLSGITSTNSTSPYQFWFTSLNGTNPDTLYVADNTTGITKYVYSTSAGTWTETGSVAQSNITGIVGQVSGSSVVLYVTSPSGLYSLTDTAAATSTLSGTPTLLASAGTNEAFRGLAFAPTAQPAAQTPESPLAIALPAAAVAIIGGAVVLGRRRRNPA